jgi:hypothetical protein
MTAPLTVDVIIDNYNYGRFLSAAIDSALAQTYDATRVVVVDDGSTDESREIIARYGDRILSVMKDNGGQASAVNAGAATSCADVVIFLDSDDVLSPETAARVAVEAARNPVASKIQYRLEVIDRDGRRTGQLKPAPHIPLPSGDLRREQLTAPFDIAWLSMSGVAFPRWVLRRLLPVPETEFPILADMYLQHLSTLLGPVVTLDWVGGGYRIHGANNYEPATSRLDLDHLRRTIVFADATRHHLLRLAGELNIESTQEMLSVSDLANRLVSSRLDSVRHPLTDDTHFAVARSGWRAAARRRDVTPAVRAAFMLWFAATAVAPRRVVVPLAERFLFPELRIRLNAVLAGQHRGRKRALR